MPIVRRTTTEGAVRWYASVETGIGPDGKRHRRGVGGYPTRKAAERAVREAQRAIDRGEYVDRTPVTLREFTEGTWLPAVRRTRKPTTAASYEALLQHHVLPDLGEVRLQALTTDAIEAVLHRLATDGRRDGTGGLAPRTIAYTRTVLHAALKDAARRGLVLRNVADGAALPKAPPQPAQRSKAWTRAELDRFLRHTSSHHHHAAWVVASATGLRRGELLGLRWGDVDLDARVLSVVQGIVLVDGVPTVSTPKSAAGVRSLKVSASVGSLLRQHRAALRDLSLGLVSDAALVFPRLLPGLGGRHRPHLEPGQPQSPGAFSGAFDRAVAGAGVPRITIHGLRHTHATLLLAAGVPVHVVSRRLGHSGPAITLSTYAHVLAGMDDAAADLFDDLAADG